MVKLSIAVILAAASLSGCVTMEQARSEGGIYPGDPKKILSEYVINHFYDPHSMRDTSYSAPQLGRLVNKGGWMVCLKTNSKNRLGGYVGLKTTTLLIQHMKVVDAVDGALNGCETAHYIDWPDAPSGKTADTQ